MNEYLLLFRADYKVIATASSEQMEERNISWMKWIYRIVKEQKLVSGNHLASTGKVLESNGIVKDGPLSEIKESILGYIIIKANSYDDSVTIASECPILGGEGNTVEIREIASL